MKKIGKTLKIKEIMIKYVKNNFKGYILTSVIFIIGLFIGVMFVNNLNQDKANMISDYIMQFINNFKQDNQIDKSELFMSSVKNNLILTIGLWIAGTTVIGMPVVLGIILYRGFCLGATIASISMALGIKKGMIFCMLSLFLQNVFFIPAIISIGVSSLKLYKSIIADRRKENIKIQIVSHTIISLLMLCILIFSSFLENEVSVGLLKFFFIGDSPE